MVTYSRPYLIGLETRWRLESPLVAETSRVSGESREIQTCSIKILKNSSLQQVSETSPSVAATSRRLILSATGETSTRRLCDVSETCWRPRRLRRRCGDVPELVVTLSGDISATSPRCRGDVSDVALASPWWKRKPFFGLPSRRDWSVTAVVATSPWWERKPFFGRPSYTHPKSE